MLTNAPSAQFIRQLAGNVYLRKIIDGALDPAGFVNVGEVQTADVTPQTDLRKFYSHRSRKRTLVKQTPSSVGFDFSLVINELAPKNIAYAFLGDHAEFTQSAGSLATTLTGVKLGGYYPLGARNVSALALTVSATPLVLGTDYEVIDAEAGLIHILESATNVADDDNVDVAGTIPAITAGSGIDWIKIGTKPSIEAQLWVLEDKDTDLQEEPSIEALFYRCAIVPGGNFPFLTQDWSSFTLNVSALDDAAGLYGGTAALPYGEIKVAAAS